MASLEKSKCLEIAMYLNHLDTGTVCDLEFSPSISFSEEDIDLIHTILSALNAECAGEPAFRPDFYILPLPKSEGLRVYKSRAYLIDQVILEKAALEKLLVDFPYAYYYIINKLIDALPKEHRDEYVSFKIPDTVYEDLIGFDPSSMPITIIKALIGLLDNPIKNKKDGQINPTLPVYNIISIKKGGE
jgi:hypothetical protein